MKQTTNKQILKTLVTHNNISISPNRWGEMCVAIQGKTIVKEIFWRQGASREVKGIWHGLSSKGTNNLQGARKKKHNYITASQFMTNPKSELT